VFGTQARPLTAPGWLDGALTFNDVVSISYIRIAIFVLALIFLAFFLYLMKRTRLGLEVRAVTQNPAMAASMGINPDRINMLTFGLGSGIAGIAGVAIGLYAKVTSEMGADYIVQSFMTVVVGGVGNVWGTLAGATMIGSLQKVIEFLNPSNTLAAQTYMILFIILFIQFRPGGSSPCVAARRGIDAMAGRRSFPSPLPCHPAHCLTPHPSPGGKGSTFSPMAAAQPLGADLHSLPCGLYPCRHDPVRSLRLRLHVDLLRQDSGKTLCLCLVALAMDLIWGYAGILSLGHMAFFALGGYMIGMWLMYARTEEIVVTALAQGGCPPRRRGAVRESPPRSSGSSDHRTCR
jgi:branched-subunit amino acid ABC-type transport system permease component